MAQLDVKKLNFSYGHDQCDLRDISLTVEPGEVVCLLGPSGSGKTTILKLISGLLTSPKRNAIFLGGKDISQMVPEKRRIGMVFQQPSLFPHLTAYGNVKLAAVKASKKKVSSHLEQVQIENVAHQYPGELSGGQQQRVAIARALANKPKMMLLDEPFASLDTVLRKKIREEVLTLLKKKNIATLIVTHDPEEALRMADRIYILYEGKIIQQGDAKTLYQKPVNHYVASFFGELNQIDAKREGNKLKSCFGAVEIPKKYQGCDVLNLYVRPENIDLYSEKGKGNCEAEIISQRYLGYMSLIFIKLKKANQHLKVRILSNALPEGVKKIYISCNKFFVFKD